MVTPVPTKDKQSFIKWFLKHYKMKKRASKWILEYLLSDPALLKNIHFVRDVEFCPKAMIISSECSDGLPFIFFKESVMTEDFEKLFHDLRLNQHDSLYVQLNFHNSRQNPEYAFIIEENPYLPINLELQEKDRAEADRLTEYMLIKSQIATLTEKINVALDQFNESRFIDITTRLALLEDKLTKVTDETNE